MEEVTSTSNKLLHSGISLGLHLFMIYFPLLLSNAVYLVRYLHIFLEL